MEQSIGRTASLGAGREKSALDRRPRTLEYWERRVAYLTGRLDVARGHDGNRALVVPLTHALALAMRRGKRVGAWLAANLPTDIAVLR